MTSQVHFIRAMGSDPADVLAAKAKRVYLATGLNDRIAEGDFAALKIHFGEAGNTGYIKRIGCFEFTNSTSRTFFPRKIQIYLFISTRKRISPCVNTLTIFPWK